MEKQILEYLQRLDTKLDDLAATTKDDLNEMFDVMKSGFDGVHHRLDGVEARLDGVEERLTGVELHVESWRSDFRLLGECSRDNSTRIHDLEHRPDELAS